MSKDWLTEWKKKSPSIKTDLTAGLVCEHGELLPNAAFKLVTKEVIEKIELTIPNLYLKKKKKIWNYLSDTHGNDQTKIVPSTMALCQICQKNQAESEDIERQMSEQKAFERKVTKQYT